MSAVLSDSRDTDNLKKHSFGIRRKGSFTVKWSWKVGKLLGIDLYVHSTFWFLLILVALMQWTSGQSVATTFAEESFVIALFACVVIHELGHAMMARHFGIATRDIILLPIGGVARLDHIPREPKEELLVAMAGPSVNVVIALLLTIWFLISGSSVSLSQMSLINGPIVVRLILVNLILFFFNLLPAFPMDGGRILRALLAQRMEYIRATQLAAHIGQFLAILMGFYSLLFAHLFLLIIAVFVFLGAGQEVTVAQVRSAFIGIPVRDAMMTDFIKLTEYDSIDSAIQLLLNGPQHDFPVLSGEQVVGIITRNDLIAAAPRVGEPITIGHIMRKDFTTALEAEMLEPVVERMQNSGCSTIPVLSAGRLVGLLSMENIAKYIMIQSARRTKPMDRTSI